jgi:hypothetical protein
VWSRSRSAVSAVSHPGRSWRYSRPVGRSRVSYSVPAPVDRKRSRGEGDGRTVGARDKDGHSAVIVAVGNARRCPCFNADCAGPGGRLSARVSPLGMAHPMRRQDAPACRPRRVKSRRIQFFCSTALRRGSFVPRSGGMHVRRRRDRRSPPRTPCACPWPEAPGPLTTDLLRCEQAR